MTKEQFIKLLRSAAVVLLTTAAHILPLENKPVYYTVAAFAVPYLIAGYDVLIKAAKDLLRLKPLGECFLMSAATLGAFAIGEYTEAIAVMLFYQIGEFFADHAVERSRRAISHLTKMRPVYADVIRDTRLVRVLPDEVSVGETVVVRPGEYVPLDGIITAGKSSLDTSALTGEALPRDVAENDRVRSGCVNLSGLLEVRVTEKAADSSLAKILDLIENQSDKKAKAEGFIRRFAAVYTPIVVLGALALFIVGTALGGEWLNPLRRSLIFLAISCPCALVISVPLSFYCGVGGLSRKGILIKGSAYLELLSRLKRVVFDKTGTLTEGSFRVASLHPVKIKKDELLSLYAHAEYNSNHPIARSIVEEYGKKIDADSVSDFKELPGLGVSARVGEKEVVCGNERLMHETGVTPDEADAAGAILHIAVDGTYAGYAVISDAVKENSAEAIESLSRCGVKKTVMLTGDAASSAKAVADELGIDEFKASLLPDEKLTELEALLDEDKGSALAYVGDGINDTPCLARADIGIAMGAFGSDAAIESADAVLMDDDPAKLATAVRGAKRTVRIARTNLVFALAVKFAVLALGAVGYADMWLAVFADVGVTLICVANALRALKIK